MDLERRVLFSMLVLASLLPGCGRKQFAVVSAGEYTCDAEVTTNTCGSAVTGSSMLQTIEGAGGNLITLTLPSQSTVSPTSDAWESAQFGAQTDRMAYAINGSSRCDTIPTHSYDYMEHARITMLDADEIDVDVTYDYTSLLTCAIPGVSTERCTLAYSVVCTHVP